jgi:DNA-binding SARP family transcriptional activator
MMVGDTPAALGSPQLRLLLAALLVHVNEVVAADRLAEILWADAPPNSSSSTLQKLVYRLRTLVTTEGVAPEVPIVVTRAPGYVLRVDSVGYDAARFTELVPIAARAFRAGDASEALA